MSKSQQSEWRLSMRREGDFWVAYFAHISTMDGAIRLGSIAIKAVEGNPERKRAFIMMMQDVVSELITDIGGSVVAWHAPVVAPEHERAGRA